VTPDQESLHQPPSLGARPLSWTQGALRELIENTRADPEHDADRDHAGEPPPTPSRREPMSSGKGGRHRSVRVAERSVRTRQRDTFDTATVTSRLRHGEPLLHRGLRWIRTLIAASQESTRLAELSASLGRPVSTGRRIAATGARCGVGTTTVALLVASVLAGRRDDAVLVANAGLDDLDSLLWRSALRAGAMDSDIAEQLRKGHVTSRQHLESLLPRTGQGLWVLGDPGIEATDRDGGPQTGVPLAMASALGRFFGVTILDCGMTANAALDTAHAQVLVAAATVDGVRAMHLLLEDLAQDTAGRLGHSVVAVVSRTSTTEGVDLTAAMRLLSAHGSPVVHIPYDRHLATGAPIDLRRVGEPTLVAAMQLADVALGLAVTQ
jgi:MinD-like ATPase involved in chromosome partitioning or flagellar assembly